MVHNLSEKNKMIGSWVGELRDTAVQADRMRFRKNLERLGEAAALQIAPMLAWKESEIETPLGTAVGYSLKNQPVIASILRAGLPMHHGLLNYFDKADNAFISAYRKHERDGSFIIHVEYVSCPDLEGRVLIVADPMLATGSSLVKTLEYLQREGKPAAVHIVCAIACTVGIEFVNRQAPGVHIWCGDVDDELTAKGYIVPGLGDAGDLAFGLKVQQ
jgi:uracil phosphoribosyltransferase